MLCFALVAILQGKLQYYVNNYPALNKMSSVPKSIIGTMEKCHCHIFKLKQVLCSLASVIIIECSHFVGNTFSNGPCLWRQNMSASWHKSIFTIHQ